MKLSLGIENLSIYDQINTLNNELKSKEYLLANLTEEDLPYQSEVVEWMNSNGNKKVYYTSTSDFVEASCILSNEVYLLKLQLTKLRNLLSKEKEEICVERNNFPFMITGFQLQPSF
jgi:hypothetical protein